MPPMYEHLVRTVVRSMEWPSEIRAGGIVDEAAAIAASSGLERAIVFLGVSWEAECLVSDGEGGSDRWTMLEAIADEISDEASGVAVEA
jgi:hypothetical protein